MACADIPMDIQQPDEADHDYEDNADDKRKPLIKYYQPTELMPPRKGPLHDLLLKQPAVLGSLQMVSGLLSVGLGFLFATTHEPTHSLLTLLRVAPVTGILFFIAGLLSNLLFKYPGLLPVCLLVNIGSMVGAFIGGVLIVVDLAFWNPAVEAHLKLEILVLCVLLEEVAASAILSFWIHKKKPIHKL
ncbi:uncharacterized protein si:ch211-269k10.4 [Esox lucius]|uniref:uncharacterized protein si:ch211-269k10.4 n=1 Tax=Esox lucius TaxID=8010 RepID=UPI0014777C71|nr:uncharacterized protein si:ch211-269k10.4 [Esox lucius]XP_034144548.1 uncharacterized protein si:ch211-269k10.4 [Esox lucius]